MLKLTWELADVKRKNIKNSKSFYRKYWLYRVIKNLKIIKPNSGRVLLSHAFVMQHGAGGAKNSFCFATDRIENI